MRRKALLQEQGNEALISRPALAARWQYHPETIKRLELKGILTPYRLNPRRVCYKVAQVLALEQQAKNTPMRSVEVPNRFVPGPAKSTHGRAARDAGQRPGVQRRESEL